MQIKLPKITYELPDGDDRVVKQVWIEPRDDGYHICLTVKDPINIPEVYQPEIWSIKKDLIIKTIAALELGLENTQEVLIDHDTRLGRDWAKNKVWAEILEGQIKDIQDCIKELKSL